MRRLKKMEDKLIEIQELAEDNFKAISTIQKKKINK